MNKFRNGTIVGDFTLSFTRGQNVSRLNQFLNRTLAQKRLFGAKILSIKFDLATAMNPNDTSDDDRIIRHYQEEEEAQSQTIQTTIDQGLSLTITISHTKRSSQPAKNYKFILIPIIEHPSSSAHSSSPIVQIQINQEKKKDDQASLATDGRMSMLSSTSPSLVSLSQSPCHRPSLSLF